MVIPTTLLLQFTGIFVGVKVLEINIKILGVILMTVIPIMVTNAIPGFTGFGIAALSFYLIIKIFDRSSGIFKIIGIIIISAVVQALLIDALVNPMFNSLLN
jgi:hypothetical protein